MSNDPLKPGLYSSEVWAGIISMIMSFLPVIYLVVHVNPSDQAAWTSLVNSSLPAVALVASNAAVAWKMIHARTQLKIEAMKADPSLVKQSTEGVT